MARRGAYTDGLDWEEYWRAPTICLPTTRVPLSFVVEVAECPVFSQPTGNFPVGTGVDITSEKPDIFLILNYYKGTRMVHKIFLFLSTLIFFSEDLYCTASLKLYTTLQSVQFLLK